MFNLNDILKATSGRLISRGSDQFTGVCIDSRAIASGDIFIPIKGERFDGHDFIENAFVITDGAIIHRIPDDLDLTGRTVVLVEDTLQALSELARYHRLREKPLVVAITGSNGKTSVKDMTACVFATELSTLKTKGNFNNEIGLPLTLSSLAGHNAAIIEMGARNKGDIAGLCDIAAPDIGIITNIGPAHLETFKSLEGVLAAKLELMDNVGRLIINHDDPHLYEGAMAKLRANGRHNITVTTFGTDDKADVHAMDMRYNDGGMSFKIVFPDSEEITVMMAQSGRINLYNGLAAATAGFLAGIKKENIAKGLNKYVGTTMRFEIVRHIGATIINDSYNANPVSMSEAINEMARIKTGRTIAVLGDMYELGDYSEAEHKKIGRLLYERNIDVFIAVGESMRHGAEKFRRLHDMSDAAGEVYEAGDSIEASDRLFAIIRDGDTVLIKGSRAMRMEAVFNHPEFVKKEENNVI